jgi:hypothetical protein
LGYEVESLGYVAKSLSYEAESLGYEAESLGYEAESLSYEAKSLGYVVEFLGYVAESLGYEAESLGYEIRGVVGWVVATLREGKANGYAQPAGHAERSQRDVLRSRAERSRSPAGCAIALRWAWMI